MNPEHRNYLLLIAVIVVLIVIIIIRPARTNAPVQGDATVVSIADDQASVITTPTNDDEILDIMKSWKSDTTKSGAGYQYPSDWSVVQNPAGYAELYPASNTVRDKNDYIVVGAPVAQFAGPNTNCVGDSEIATCALSNNPQTLEVFKLMTHFE